MAQAASRKQAGWWEPPRPQERLDSDTRAVQACIPTEFLGYDRNRGLVRDTYWERPITTDLDVANIISRPAESSHRLAAHWRHLRVALVPLPSGDHSASGRSTVVRHLAP
jgi:hypothetical protein